MDGQGLRTNKVGLDPNNQTAEAGTGTTRQHFCTHEWPALAEAPWSPMRRTNGIELTAGRTPRARKRSLDTPTF